MITDVMFEQLYKAFLSDRTEWLNLAHKLAIYHGTSPAGQKVRPIGLTANPRMLARARELVDRWQRFYDFATECSEKGIRTCSPVLYNQVPAVIGGFQSFSINSFDATSVSKLYREELLAKINKKLDKMERANKLDPITLANLKMDLKVFSRYPEGTVFRIRTTGYRDIFVDFFKHPAHTPSLATENQEPESERIRIAAPGIIIDGSSMQDINSWKINDDSKSIDYQSIYKSVSPIPCSILTSSEVYLLEDVENAKKDRNKRMAAPIPHTVHSTMEGNIPHQG